MASADSAVVSTVAPALLGAWIHDPTLEVGTERNFPYSSGNGDESMSTGETFRQFVGRRFPVMETGEYEDHAVALTIEIPFDADHDAAVAWWRAAKRAGRTLFYRDGRGRAMPVGMSGALAISPTRAGSTVSVTLRRVDYPAGV